MVTLFGPLPWNENPNKCFDKYLFSIISRISIKNLASNNTIRNFTAWESHPEELEIPSPLQFSNENLCGDKDFTLLTAIYRGYGKMGPLRRNPQSIRAREIKLDSKPVSVKLMLSSGRNK